MSDTTASPEQAQSHTARPDLLVRIPDDRLSVVVDCEVPEGDYDLLVKRIQREVMTMGVAAIPATAELEAWLRQKAAEAGETRYISGAVLLSGQAPVQPVDGQIIWAAPFFEQGFIVDEATGAIDYRQHAAQRSVAANQLLAHVVAPVEGQDGVDVMGRKIRVKKAKGARLLGAENVRRIDATAAAPTSFYAKCDGRIRLTKNGLAVDPVYRVNGSVGLETGNIRHPGSLEVLKDVDANSEIATTGDIEVFGYVEAANIETKGCFTARGGVSGAPGKAIRVGGSIQAKFILEADIEAEGDVVVEREIVQSVIKTRGSVTIPNGRIIGGEIIALGGILVGQTGSPASVRTYLAAGEDFLLEREVAEMDKKIRAIEESRSHIQAGLKPMLAMVELLSAQKKDAIRQLLAQDNELKKEAEDLRDQIEEMREASKKRAKPVVEIRRVAHSETVIAIHKERLRVQGDFLGPARARIHEGKIDLRVMTIDQGRTLS